MIFISELNVNIELDFALKTQVSVSEA